MSDPQPLVFADLDDTLFQLRRKVDRADIERQTAVADNGDLRKSSFMTAQGSVLCKWLHKATKLIPVTARSADAFDRVDLLFTSWAILSNGAMIREPDSTTHAPRAAKMGALLAPLAETMQHALEQVRAATVVHGIDVRSWIVAEDGLATYVVFKPNDVTGVSLAALEALPLPVTDWTRHFNFETLAVIPPGSGKAVATDYLRKLLEPKNKRPSLCFGDSQSDLTFATTTDVMMMIPSPSQIANSS